MKFKTIMLALAGLFLFLSLSFSQEEQIVLDHKEIGVHQRPLSHLSHEKHAEIIDCNRCHHEYDENGNNIGEDGQSCSECHSQVESTENPVSLLEAFHILCKSCHEKRLSNGETSGPVMCGQCHKRQ